MRRTTVNVLAAMMSLLVAVTSTEGYEDNTHKQLSKRALQVAASNAGARRTGVRSSVLVT